MLFFWSLTDWHFVINGCVLKPANGFGRNDITNQNKSKVTDVNVTRGSLSVPACVCDVMRLYCGAVLGAEST